MFKSTPTVLKECKQWNNDNCQRFNTDAWMGNNRWMLNIQKPKYNTTKWFKGRIIEVKIMGRANLNCSNDQKVEWPNPQNFEAIILPTVSVHMPEWDWT